MLADQFNDAVRDLLQDKPGGGPDADYSNTAPNRSSSSGLLNIRRSFVE
jgi:hypothetical protein